jgi:methionyl-tRNA formyltransferase
MELADIGLIAADTARSRCYLQALVAEDLRPAHVLLMESAGQGLPGQAAGVAPAPVEFLGLAFRPAESLRQTLLAAEVPFSAVHSTDINDAAVVAALRARPETVFVFSGVGGQILREAVLGCGKRFLHSHGGYLPDYRGSTTNYYSLLREGRCGASTLFLTDRLDGGPVLLRRRFGPPPDRTQLDYVYDSMFRARVLIDTLREYRRTAEWKVEKTEAGGLNYYIMHPVLRHIAIMAGNAAP